MFAAGCICWLNLPGEYTCLLVYCVHLDAWREPTLQVGFELTCKSRSNGGGKVWLTAVRTFLSKKEEETNCGECAPTLVGAPLHHFSPRHPRCKETMEVSFDRSASCVCIHSLQSQGTRLRGIKHQRARVLRVLFRARAPQNVLQLNGSTRKLAGSITNTHAAKATSSSNTKEGRERGRREDHETTNGKKLYRRDKARLYARPGRPGAPTATRPPPDTAPQPPGPLRRCCRRPAPPPPSRTTRSTGR
jgi:hypothetical protein